MASFCKGSIAAAGQHATSFQQGSVQVSIQSSSLPQHNHLRPAAKAVGLTYSCDNLLSSKQLPASNGSFRRSRKKFTTTCVVTTAVVEQDTELNGKPNSPKTQSLNSKPVYQVASPQPPQVVLKPAPRPVPQPRPQLNAPALPADANAGNRSAWINGAKRGGNEPPLHRKVFRPGDKTVKPNDGADAKNPIDSLGQILEKAEKLIEQNTSPQLKDTRFIKSTWRKGVGMDKPPPVAPSQGDKTAEANDIRPPVEESSRAATATSPPDASINASQSSPANTSTSVKLGLNKPEVRKPALKLAVKPPQSREGPQRPKQIILRDVGAAAKPTIPSKDKAAAAIAGVDGSAGPGKSGKAGTLKGKDGKEDWRKKMTTGADGPKRRVVAKAGAVEDGDLTGGVGSARRTGRKMSKATRKAARVEAARAAAPVRVEILEVGKEGLSVPDLAQKLAVNDAEIVKTLFLKGIATTVNQTLDEETVKLVCQEFEVEVVEAGTVKVEEMAKKRSEFLDGEDIANLIVRPPVVTIMGHVDHGKTSLLDFIRKSKVAASEAGGITQGIGAYRVNVTVEGEVQSCVFLDTPGHQAFSAMRARGARITDVAVVVVAADDGVRPQTQEAIAHAKAANVPIVVAINKIDKEGAEPERVMQELAGVGLLPEDWGGDVPMVQISALKGQNVDTLLETIMLVAEFQELKANPNRSAKGTVVESCLDKTKGVMATFLIQNGTLNKGDVVLCGKAYGKVRALLDDTGTRVNKAGPSTAVQVVGLSSVPLAGDEFEVLDSLDVARDRAEECADAARFVRLAAQAAEGKVTLASLAASVAEGQAGGVERHELNVILKVDVQGTLEAIREALRTLPQDTVNLRMLMQATGDVTSSDVDLAIASEAVIIGFNVGVQSSVQTHADNKGVEIRQYKVIYELIDDIRKAMEGLLDVIEEEVPIGTAEVRAVFVSGSGKVAGCMVTDGKIVKGCGCKVLRGGVSVHTGTVVSLRRVKELAKEVVAGLECGIGVGDFNEWQEGDILEAFDLVAKKRTLEEAAVATASSFAAVAASASAISTTTTASTASPRAS